MSDQSLEMELLKERRRIAYHHMLSSHSIYIRAQKLYFQVKARYEADKLDYETTDKKLAMIDGRLRIEPPNASGKKVKTTNVELTEDQIIQIALELGLKLPEIEVREEDEEKQLNDVSILMED